MWIELGVLYFMNATFVYGLARGLRPTGDAVCQAANSVLWPAWAVFSLGQLGGVLARRRWLEVNAPASFPPEPPRPKKRTMFIPDFEWGTTVFLHFASGKKGVITGAEEWSDELRILCHDGTAMRVTTGKFFMDWVKTPERMATRTLPADADFPVA